MINLNVKSGYSFLKSTLKVNDIINLNKENKSHFAAVNDHNVMFAFLSLEKEARKNDLTPLYLVNFKVLHNENLYSVSLLVSSLEGYKNICKLSSKISSRFEKSLDLDLLNDYLKGNILIIHSSFLNEEIFDAIKYESIYIGLEAHYDEEVIKRVREVAQRRNIKIIPFNEIVYKNDNDLEVYKCLRAIENNDEIANIVFNNEKKLSPLTKEEYHNLYLEEEIFTLESLVKSIKFNIYDSKVPFISYPLDSNIKKDEYFYKLAYKGLIKRLNSEDIPSIYLTRFNYEFDVIKKMGYIDYFLVVWDYVKYARKSKIEIGPGRGSACGSLISYCLGITNVDPLKYNLYFERFLNPERVSMPDIDIDFLDTRREEVVNYLISKYGLDKAVHVVAFSTLGVKQSLRDAGKALGLSLRDIDYISKSVVLESPSDTLDSLYENNKKFKEFIESRKIYREVFKIARRIEGLPRQTTLHAAGIVVSNNSLYEYTPLYEHDNGVFATQFDLNFIEGIGMLKMDLLGLKNLGILNEVINLVTKKNPNFDINKIDLNDARVLKMLSLGYTCGIFQLEKPGMVRAIKKVGLTSFNDLSLMLALYRPGPMEQIDILAKRKNNKEEVSYLHPSLKEILEETYGIIVYQEQIMQILQKVGKFSLGKADIVRRAISKKDTNKMNDSKDEFILNATKEGYSLSIASKIWDLTYKFANYGFNKAHSVAYALISYQLAYLKCYYPNEFFTALLNSLDGAVINNLKFINYYRALSIQKVSLSLPDVNKSFNCFKLEGGLIYYPLNSIKGLNNQICHKIISEREKGEFVDFIDFVIRMYKHDLNSEHYLALINSGAFDSFKINRQTYRNNLIRILDYCNLIEGIFDENVISRPNLKMYDDNKEYDLHLEYEHLGILLSNIPSFNLKETLTPISKISNYVNKDLNILGFLITAQEIRTKNNQIMAKLGIISDSQMHEIILFPKIYEQYKNSLKLNSFYLLNVNVGNYHNEISLNVNSLRKL